MEKYILTKTQKGKKYLYEVKDENGNVVSKRTSTRDYVACSVSGEFYFGRLDLVGKGTHGGPNGYISCEGRCCQEAYEMYIEEWTE